MCDDIGICGLSRYSFKAADFAGKCADDILWCINCDADDADLFFTVRNAHTADDVVTGIVEKLVQGFNRLLSSTIMEITATLVSI